jgi:hypothetical protein
MAAAMRVTLRERVARGRNLTMNRHLYYLPRKSGDFSIPDLGCIVHLMTALGHKRPVKPILPERLLSGVKRTFRNNYSEIKLPIVLGEI